MSLSAVSSFILPRRPALALSRSAAAGLLVVAPCATPNPPANTPLPTPAAKPAPTALPQPCREPGREPRCQSGSCWCRSKPRRQPVPEPGPPLSFHRKRPLSVTVSGRPRLSWGVSPFQALV